MKFDLMASKNNKCKKSKWFSHFRKKIASYHAHVAENYGA